mgnify:CR=1 FL=1
MLFQSDLTCSAFCVILSFRIYEVQSGEILSTLSFRPRVNEVNGSGEISYKVGMSRLHYVPLDMTSYLSFRPSETSGEISYNRLFYKVEMSRLRSLCSLHSK